MATDKVDPPKKGVDSAVQAMLGPREASVGSMPIVADQEGQTEHVDDVDKSKSGSRSTHVELAPGNQDGAGLRRPGGLGGFVIPKRSAPPPVFGLDSDDEEEVEEDEFEGYGSGGEDYRDWEDDPRTC